jgi:hypothetical protein
LKNPGFFALVGDGGAVTRCFGDFNSVSVWLAIAALYTVVVMKISVQIALIAGPDEITDGG